MRTKLSVARSYFAMLSMASENINNRTMFIIFFFRQVDKRRILAFDCWCNLIRGSDGEELGEELFDRRLGLSRGGLDLRDQASAACDQRGNKPRHLEGCRNMHGLLEE